MKQLRPFFLCTLLWVFSGLMSQPAFGQPIAKLLASDGTINDKYGSSVSISPDGNTAIVGANGDDVGSNTDQGSAYVYTRNGFLWTQQAQLVAFDGAAMDYFGAAVSISGDGNTIVIGANGDDDQGFGEGSAYVFTRSGTTWTQQTKLLASDRAAMDYFGVAVSISKDGNTVIVGANGSDINSNTDQGSAYVFTRNGTIWTQQTKLLAADGAASDYFGASVSISGDGNTAIIGSYGDDINSNTDQGSAYIYTRSGTSWAQQSKLLGGDGATSDNFGASVAISPDGNMAIVGAYGDDVGSNIDQGSAYVYTPVTTTWTQQTKLLAFDGAAMDYFGFSVSIGSLSINGDRRYAIIGAYGDDLSLNSNIDQGAAYGFLYVPNAMIWLPLVKQQSSDGSTGDGAAGDNFGFSVSISEDGNIAIVGANGDDVGTNADQGSAYIVAPPVILPLTLTDFTVAKQANASVLNWKVAQEQNIATYTIERSTDSRSFTTVGSIVSPGNTSSSRAYSFTDFNPVKSANYYRLKITEKDSKVSYSEVRLLNFGSQISIAVYPNPAKEKATLTGVEAGMSIRLLDAAGKVLQVQKVTGTTESLILRSLARGFYTVQVSGASGNLLSSTPLVKE